MLNVCTGTDTFERKAYWEEWRDPHTCRAVKAFTTNTHVIASLPWDSGGAIAIYTDSMPMALPSERTRLSKQALELRREWSHGLREG